MVEEKKSLATKLSEIMSEVKRIPKRGRNTFHGYDYVTEADMAEAIRDRMAEKHVILVPDIQSHEIREHAETARGKKQFLTIVRIHFFFIDGDDPNGQAQNIGFNFYGYGIDGEDKGIYKAITGAEKYALMKFFLVATGDDPEESGGSGTREDVEKLKKSSSVNRGHGDEGFKKTVETPAQVKQAVTPKTTAPVQKAQEAASASASGMMSADIVMVGYDSKETAQKRRYMVIKDSGDLNWFIWHESLHEHIIRPWVQCKRIAEKNGTKPKMELSFRFKQNGTGGKMFRSIEEMTYINGVQYEDNLPVIDINAQ